MIEGFHFAPVELQISHQVLNFMNIPTSALMRGTKSIAGDQKLQLVLFIFLA